MNHQTTQAFGPPLIGQTEKAFEAILVRELEGSGVTPSGWVLMRLAGGADASVGRGELIDRAGRVSKFDPGEVGAGIDALVESGYLEDGEVGLALTTRARGLQARVDSAIAEVTGRLWGDLPEADIAATGRVLRTVLSRANAELGS